RARGTRPRPQRGAERRERRAPEEVFAQVHVGGSAQHTSTAERLRGASRMQGIVRIVAYLGVGLVAGFAIAQWMSQDDGETASPDDATWLAGRIDALERELARERSARAALAAAIEELRAAISSEDAYGSDADLPWMREPGGIVRVERELAESAAELEGSPVPAAGSVRFGGRPSAEEIERRRRERFIAAGFTPDRVQ